MITQNDMAEKLNKEISARRGQLKKTMKRKKEMLRAELEPRSREWFDEVDENGDEVLDCDEFVELASKHGVQLTREAADSIMQTILDPDGTRNLLSDDKVVEFEEFFEWYLENGVVHGKAKNLKALFAAAQEEHKEERAAMEERRAEEMEEDARTAFDEICKDGKLTKRTIVNLAEKMNFTLTSEEAKLALREMNEGKKGGDGGFDEFKKWFAKNVPRGRRSVLGGGFTKYFATLQKKLRQTKDYDTDSDDDESIQKKLAKEAKTLFRVFAERSGKDEGKMNKGSMQKLYRTLGYETKSRTIKEAMADMSGEKGTTIEKADFVDWWKENARKLPDQLEARQAGSDSDDEDILFSGGGNESDDSEGKKSAASASRIKYKYRKINKARLGGSSPSRSMLPSPPPSPTGDTPVAWVVQMPCRS